VKNLAFIDGQNLHLGTMCDGWKVDFERFRIYLRDKYKTAKAYYFIGYYRQENAELYRQIQEAGFVLVFRQHNTKMQGKKKGNVDSDIIFLIMRKLYYKEYFNRIILVSGDGDFKMLVDFLIKEGRFLKILFPNKKFASSLYHSLGSEHFDFLSNIKNNIT
jgi:uncharacterized LabA/DUF88 family protein